MRKVGLWVILAACGGSGKATVDAPNTACKDMGGSACWYLPTAPMSTRDGTPSALGCGPVVPATAPAAVNVSGKLVAYSGGTGVPNGTIKVYSSADFSTPVVTATSAADGTYSVQYPMGTPELLWGEFSAANYLTLFPEGVRPDLQHGDLTNYNLRIATPSDIEAAGIPVMELWDPTVAVVAGTALDCNRMIVEHAAVVLSSTSGTRTFVPHASLYYGAAGVVPLAVPPDDRMDTNDNGAFAIFRVPGGQPLFIQMWGFKDAAAQAQGEAGLTLVAEWPLHSAVNTVSNVQLWVNK